QRLANDEGGIKRPDGVDGGDTERKQCEFAKAAHGGQSRWAKAGWANPAGATPAPSSMAAHWGKGAAACSPAARPGARGGALVGCLRRPSCSRGGAPHQRCERYCDRSVRRACSVLDAWVAKRGQPLIRCGLIWVKRNSGGNAAERSRRLRAVRPAGLASLIGHPSGTHLDRASPCVPRQTKRRKTPARL